MGTTRGWCRRHARDAGHGGSGPMRPRGDPRRRRGWCGLVAPRRAEGEYGGERERRWHQDERCPPRREHRTATAGLVPEINHRIGVSSGYPLDAGTARWRCARDLPGIYARAQQRVEIGGGVRIAAFQGTVEGCLGAAEIAALREDRTQVAGCCSLSSLVCDSIGALGSRDVTTLL
jgi:hypothetical protein